MTVRRFALKYILMGDNLYFRTIGDIVLERLDEGHAKFFMGDIHHVICDIHKSTM